MKIILEVDGIKHLLVTSEVSDCCACSLKSHCSKYRGFSNCPASSLSNSDGHFELVKTK